MHWKAYVEPNIGDRRTTTHFALTPIRINDVWIWLKCYKVVEEFESLWEPWDGGCKWYTGRGWVIREISVKVNDKLYIEYRYQNQPKFR